MSSSPFQRFSEVPAWHLEEQDEEKEEEGDNGEHGIDDEQNARLAEQAFAEIASQHAELNYFNDQFAAERAGELERIERAEADLALLQRNIAANPRGLSEADFIMEVSAETAALDELHRVHERNEMARAGWLSEISARLDAADLRLRVIAGMRV